MWPARAALRPVPAHAVVTQEAVDTVESDLGDHGDLEAHIVRSLRELENTAPALAQYLAQELDPIHDETANALGQFLGVVVHRAFAECFGQRLMKPEASQFDTMRAMFDWDEELRRGAADEALESDDVVAIGQPHVVAFVREQIEASLEPDEDGEPADVDLDAVSAVYRVVLVEILVLGQCVAPPRGVTARETMLA